MTAEVRFCALRICVINMERSKKFYSDLFNAIAIEQSDGFVCLSISGLRLELVRADQKNPVGLGGSIGYFDVGDLQDCIERSKLLGSEVWRGPIKIEKLGSWIAQIRDPDDNVIGLQGWM